MVRRERRRGIGRGLRRALHSCNAVSVHLPQNPLRDPRRPGEIHIALGKATSRTTGIEQRSAHNRSGSSSSSGPGGGSGSTGTSCQPMLQLTWSAQLLPLSCCAVAALRLTGVIRPVSSGRHHQLQQQQQHRTPLAQQQCLQAPWQDLQREARWCSSSGSSSSSFQSQAWRRDPARHQARSSTHSLLPPSAAAGLQPLRCLHSSAAAGAADDSTKSSKGEWPTFGPSHQTLKALPFSVSRAAAAAAFTAYHGTHWYQSRQAPVLAKPFKEAFLPFWVASGKVQVDVRGAEVGHSHLVTRHDRRTGKAEPHWETVWSRVSVRLAWERQLQPEEPDLQLYGSWKYSRRDIEALRPGPLLKQARPITPDMLQATPGSGITTRRVGPFTLDPHRARRLIMAAVEAQERQRAEKEIARLSGAQEVRFVDLHCTWWGSTGAAAGGSVGAAAARRGGLDLAPVYVPAFVFSWWHGGAKVRSFVSGLDVSQVAGVQVLDDTKLATMTAATTASMGLLLGLSLPVLFWSGFVVPFVAAGFVSRFWPLLRSTAVNWWERWQEKRGRFSFNKEHRDFCEVDYNAAFVHSYERYEQRQQQNEQRQQYQQDHGWGSFAGRQAGPFQAFQEIFKDPFSWFEKHYARQQKQQFGGAQQQQGARPGSGGGQGRATGAGGRQARAGPGSSRDPQGFYETLGVAPGCSMPELQSAFRGLAMQHHPDRYTSAEDKARATKRFQAITEAYQTLRDPKKRQQYDQGQWRA